LRRSFPFAGLAWILFICTLSLFAPQLTVHDPVQPVAARLTAPQVGMPLGTDHLGRDLLTRLLYGGRFSLIAAGLAALITILVGGGIGFIASLLEGWMQRFFLQIINASLAIPGLLFAMLLISGLGTGLHTVVLAVGLGSSPGFARLLYGFSNTIRHAGYIQTATSMGASRSWNFRKHILPNLRPQILSLSTTYTAWSFAGITTLTFLGLAGDPTVPEWGVMLNAGRAYLAHTPSLALWPGLLISLTILSIHSLGAWYANDAEPVKIR